MYFIQLNMIPILYSLFWFFINIIHFSNAKQIEVNDYSSFEKELNNCKSKNNLDFIVKKNITIPYQLKFECNKNTIINISGIDDNTYINQNFHDEQGPHEQDIFNNYMINLSNIGSLNLKKININGNVYVEKGGNIEFKNFIMKGDTFLSNIKNEIIIDNIKFETNNEITNGNNMVYINESKVTISNCIFESTANIEQVIYLNKCDNIDFDNLKINGSFDKKIKPPSKIHKSLRFNTCTGNIKNMEIFNFRDTCEDGYYGYMITFKYSNIIISDSKIYNGYGSYRAAIDIDSESIIKFNNSTFENLYVYSEVSIINNQGKLMIDSCKFINSDYEDNFIFNNEKIFNSGFMICGDNLSETNVYNVEIQNFNVNCIFFIKGFSKMIITNAIIEDIELRSYGAVFSTYKTKEAKVDIKDVKLTNIQRKGEKHGALLTWQESDSIINIDGLIFIGGFADTDQSRISYVEADGTTKLSIRNSKFYDIYTPDYSIGFCKGKSIILDTLEFYNCSTDTGLVGITGVPEVKSIGNIIIDGFNYKSLYSYSHVFLIHPKEADEYIPIENITIKNSKFATFLTSRSNSRFDLVNIKADNNIIFGSFLYASNIRTLMFRFNVTSSQFTSNTGVHGTVFYNSGMSIDDVVRDKTMVFKDCDFINNTATNRGGIFFTEDSLDFLYFRNCTFYNNTAPVGTIGFSTKKEYEPHFEPDIHFQQGIYSDGVNLLTDGTSYGKAFVTNPTNVTCTYNIPDVFYSGDKIKDITCKLYDDYNNEYKIDEVDKLELNALNYFEISSNDEVMLKGKTKDYCRKETSCSIQNLSVIGNEGNYNLFFKIIQFGNILPFDSLFSIPVTISKCPSEHYYNVAEDDNKDFISCHKLECTPPCMHGECIKNKCSCSNTKWIGELCELKPQYKNVVWLKILFYCFTIIGIILVLTLIGLIIFLRNVKEIKIAKPFFLLSILIGIIFELTNVILIYQKSSYLMCITILSLKYLGQAFIYGSIFVKCYQISNIYNTKKYKVVTNSKIMFLYYCIVMAHLVLLLIWITIDNNNLVDIGTNRDNEQYNICGKPRTSLIGNVFSCFFIISGLNELYKARFIPENLKEPLGMPIYVYSINVLIDIFSTTYNKTLSPHIITSIQSISILIFCSVVAYCLIFKKIYAVIYNFYIVESDDVVNSDDINDNSVFNTKRISNNYALNRNDNQRFAISSIKCF